MARATVSPIAIEWTHRALHCALEFLGGRHDLRDFGARDELPGEVDHVVAVIAAGDEILGLGARPVEEAELSRPNGSAARISAANASAIPHPARTALSVTGNCPGRPV